MSQKKQFFLPIKIVETKYLKNGSCSLGLVNSKKIKNKNKKFDKNPLMIPISPTIQSFSNLKKHGKFLFVSKMCQQWKKQIQKFATEI